MICWANERTSSEEARNTGQPYCIRTRGVMRIEEKKRGKERKRVVPHQKSTEEEAVWKTVMKK